MQPRFGDRVIRRPREADISPSPIELSPQRLRIPFRGWSSPWAMVFGFAILVLLGTFLLWIPFASKDPGFTPLLIALFTAMSAVTTTGLVIVESGTYWTFYGQGVLLLLIFIGGLGFMTSAILFILLIGQRISLTGRLLLSENLGMGGAGGILRLVAAITITAVFTQIVGTLVLLFSLYPEFSLREALWQSLFHSVSAFNNAGFAIVPDSSSLMRFQNDYVFLLPIMALIIVGGIGYTVLSDLIKIRKFSRFSLDTKLVLTLSVMLWILGTIVLLVMEYSNPETIGNLSLPARIVNSLFHSISRTAGFSTVNQTYLAQHTAFFDIGLMFIGGASASTASGIKVNTLAVVLVAVLSTAQGKTRPEIFGREIPSTQVFRAITVIFIATIASLTVVLSLTITESLPFLDILFESISAFANCGLSTGITGELTPIGASIIAIAMFAGRLGPLTLILSLSQRGDRRAIYRLGQERVKIG